MELSDSRIVAHVQSGSLFLLEYRLTMNGPNPYTYNHIAINVANVLSLFLGCLGAGLLFAYASRSISPRHKQWKGLVEVLGWGSWIFMPGLIFWVSGTPSLTYGSVYWNYLGLTWYGGVFVMWFIFSEVLVFHGFYSRKLAKLIPRSWQAWARPDFLPYIQAWFLFRLRGLDRPL